MNRSLLIVVLSLFSLQAVYVLATVGYWEIWRYALVHPAGQQVLADLFIALSFVMGWIRGDAKRRGRVYWPWLLFAIVAGSFAPLIYLLTQRRTVDRQSGHAAQGHSGAKA
jgi:hypothetical protein